MTDLTMTVQGVTGALRRIDRVWLTLGHRATPADDVDPTIRTSWGHMGVITLGLQNLIHQAA